MNTEAIFPRVIELFYRRVTPQEFARLQGDPKAAASFFGTDANLEETFAELAELLAAPQKREPEKDDPVRVLCIGPYWHALHFVLTGESDLKPDPLPNSPLGNVVGGGTETPWTCTHGRVRMLAPDQVREAAAALDKISVEELRSRLSIAALDEAKIYRRGGRACWTAEDAEPLFSIYPQVVDFFQSAARDGDLILLSSD